MDIAKASREAQEVEAIAAEIYLLLAVRSAETPEQAACFRRLEEEEREHVKRLQMLASMYLNDSRTFRGAQLEIADLDPILAKLRALRDAVQRGTLTVLAAVVRMVELEERFSVTHAEVVAKNADPAVKALFTMLAAQDREHARLLQRMQPAGARKARPIAAGPAR